MKTAKEVLYYFVIKNFVLKIGNVDVISFGNTIPLMDFCRDYTEHRMNVSIEIMSFNYNYGEIYVAH